MRRPAKRSRLAHIASRAKLLENVSIVLILVGKTNEKKKEIQRLRKVEIAEIKTETC